MRRRWGRGGSSSAVELRHPSMCSTPSANLPAWPLGPFTLARWTGANLTELPAVLGGLRQPCSATRGRGFCPQLVQGRAEPAAEG